MMKYDDLLVSKRIIAFIPARGGSKGIPGKNIKEINGKPLLYWCAKAASDCLYIKDIYISTDDERIACVANNIGLSKIRIFNRDPLTATDTATTESAMLDFAEQVDFDYIVLLQATSPLTASSDLTQSIEKYFSSGADSLMSAVLQTSFLWTNTEGYIQPINYDPVYRPRRQDHRGCLVENGAFYITRKDFLLKTKCRISGNVIAHVMDNDSYFEIDDVADFAFVEQLLKRRENIF